MRHFLPLLVLILTLAPSGFAQDSKVDLEKTFVTANTLLEQKKYAAALVEYRKILALEPDLDAPLRNGAMAAYFAGDYKTALQYYQKLKASDRNDGFIRAKLVQVYQAMGDEKGRDTERSELIALHKSGKDTSSLAKRTDFCRDQYRLGTQNILVYEPFVFVPRKDGLLAARYQFLVADGSGNMQVRIEAGWDAAKKDAAGDYHPDTSHGGFYFDAYYPSGPFARRTMGVFEAEPPYGQVKAYVQAILEGKVKPTGGTLR